MQKRWHTRGVPTPTAEGRAFPARKDGVELSRPDVILPGPLPEPTYHPTDSATAGGRTRTVPRMTATSPKVAMISDRQSPGPARAVAPICTIDSANIALAATTQVPRQ